MAGAKTDPYAILGVARDADAKTIKSAYRRLAQTHHPDRNQDDAIAEERFKQISSAYAVLSDTKRRKDYDEFGSIAMDPNFNSDNARASRRSPFGGGFGGQGGFGNVFDEFFTNGGGGFSRQRGPRKTKGRDREVVLQLDLREASEGCERLVSLGRPGAPGSSGETLRVRIPPGTRHDGRIRLGGKGEPGAHGGPSGDLYCRIKLRPHAYFKLDEFDLLLDVPISLKEAMLGAEIEIPTLAGRVTLNVPAGTDAGSRLRLRAKGMARPGDKPPGDLYVTLLIRVPKQLDETAREHVLELDRLGPTDLRKHLLD
jgi:DnaJ-class molecular chaperone